VAGCWPTSPPAPRHPRDWLRHLGTTYRRRSTLEDGAGFSVSMYIRVTNKTKGFAFAVTDAFENTQSRPVYTLDRPVEMIENGRASSSWFNSTHRV